MLKLERITKIYETSDSKVEALKGIDLCFRKNEFVSILGPSGCGKTTTLNIIGGLDHYTDGDLFINGRSTKGFTDHDWDIYRNHRIGFVFQSYNLIPQEDILENVELALAIGGMSKQERTEKAKKALDQVGLEGLYHKKPNQLSGGQCQRVAIARALVNEPEILLADEPTGALDSLTSVQIMDLIKEISKEKLVIMVTHNPDIAEKYSTRIIRLLDGKVVEDSNPYSASDEAKEYEKSEPLLEEKAAMSWWTAFKLSGKNLFAKKKRTILTIIASSIGIVGISAVLAVSFGVRGYISDMQDDMLSGNPISIAESSFSLSSLLSDVSTSTKTSVLSESWKDGKIDINFMTETLVNVSSSMDASLQTNTMTAEYESYIDAMPESYYAAISKQYGINVKNNIYTDCQVNLKEQSARYSISGITSFCETILENARDGEWSSYASMIDSFTEVIGQSLDERDYVLSQYDIVAGSYPEKENEMALVLNHSNKESDFVLTLLGFYGQEEFANALYHFSGDEQEDTELWEKQQQIPVETILNKNYYYYPNDSIFKYNDAYNPDASAVDYALDPTVGQPYTYDFDDGGDIADAMEMSISCILTPKEDVSYGCYSQGLYFTPSFAQRFIKDNYDSGVTSFIRDYLANNESATSFSSSIISLNGMEITSGIGYEFDLIFEDKGEAKEYHGEALVGEQSQMSALMGMLSTSTSSGSSSGTGLNVEKMASLSLRDVGGNDIPGTIDIYPNNFNDKYLVTDYLDAWNDDGEVRLADGRTLKADEREEITYSDDLQLVISLINGVIDIVTIALVCFTALSLVVSTVMIGIITYVSVMERVKEIGVIRSLGGRKKDVSHLFNAETFMIGLMSGAFGIIITYLIELVLNLSIGTIYELGMIANLPIYVGIIVIICSILLTVIAGLLPAKSAAKQDPVAALRSE